jgi:hypothetical protein
MKQAELDRAVAHVTGETVDRISRIGFTLVKTPPRVLKMTRRFRRRKGRLQLVAVAV